MRASWWSSIGTQTNNHIFGTILWYGKCRIITETDFNSQNLFRQIKTDF